MTQALIADTMKKWLSCLGCGKQMWTDRCHRICKKCRRRNEATPCRSAHGIALPRGYDLYTAGILEREEF